MSVNQNAFTSANNAAGASANPASGASQRFSTNPTSAMGLVSPVGQIGSGGEMYEKLVTLFQERVKGLNENIKSGDESYHVIKLLKQPAGLNYANILLVQKLHDTVAAHVLIIESTGTYPDARIETVGNMRYEVVRTPGDALDETLIEQCQIAVGQALKINPSDVIVVDGTLVPREFDIADEHQVQALMINTFNATHTELQIRVNDYKGTNLTDFLQKNRNGKFQVNVAFNEADLIFTDQSGMPIRQDVCISLSYKLGGQTNNWSVHQGDNTVDVVKTYGYFDIENIGPAFTNGMPSSQRFVPNFIITHIESPYAPTPDLVMRAVLSVFSLNENMNWLSAFRLTMAKKGEIDYSDIGALNVEGNIEQNPTGFGKRYDTKTKTITPLELSQFVQRLVFPNQLAISIDLAKASPDTWTTSLFHAIKFDPVNGPGAMERLNRFLVHSTGNIFQPGNLPVFIHTTNKFHGGYYKAPDKSFRDLRCLTNYLAVANFVVDTNQPPAKISQYTNTLYSQSLPDLLRAAVRREQYLLEMSQNSAVIKQTYDRVTFSRDYLQNYLNAMTAAGYAPMFANAVNNDVFVTRATGDFASALFGQDARLMGHPTVNYGNFNQFSNYGRTF